MPAEPPTAGSLNAIARASTSAWRNAAGVEISGASAPSRTATLMRTVAISARLLGTSRPACSSESIAGFPLITTSAVSPASSRCASAPTVPKLSSTSFAVVLVKSQASAVTTSCIERAHMILSFATSPPLPHNHGDAIDYRRTRRGVQLGETEGPDPRQRPHRGAGGVQPDHGADGGGRGLQGNLPLWRHARLGEMRHRGEPDAA